MLLSISRNQRRIALTTTTTKTTTATSNECIIITTTNSNRWIQLQVPVILLLLLTHILVLLLQHITGTVTATINTVNTVNTVNSCSTNQIQIQTTIHNKNINNNYNNNNNFLFNKFKRTTKTSFLRIPVVQSNNRVHKQRHRHRHQHQHQKEQFALAFVQQRKIIEKVTNLVASCIDTNTNLQRNREQRSKHLLSLLLLSSRPHSLTSLYSSSQQQQDESAVTTTTNVMPAKEESLSSVFTSTSATTSVGLYNSFAKWAWDKLVVDDESLHLQDITTSIDPIFQTNTAPAVGGSVQSSSTSTPSNQVRITIKCAKPKCDDNSIITNFPIRYVRFALIETIPTTSTTTATTTNSNDDLTNNNNKINIITDGIQVLNMVIFPSITSNLPVWGADFVTLPGNKHLLLLDSQPMSNTNNSNTNYESHWDDWYQRHVVNNNNNNNNSTTGTSSTLFPWGGTIPEQVQQYVSKNALWTRFVVPTTPTSTSTNTSKTPGMVKEDSTVTATTSTTDTVSSVESKVPTTTTSTAVTMNPIDIIQGPLLHAFQEHLKLYIQLVVSSTTSKSTTTNNNNTTSIDNNINKQSSYIQYRLNNDPARPMLNRLYGKEWTESVLHTVLFPE